MRGRALELLVQTLNPRPKVACGLVKSGFDTTAKAKLHSGAAYLKMRSGASRRQRRRLKGSIHEAHAC